MPIFGNSIPCMHTLRRRNVFRQEEDRAVSVSILGVCDRHMRRGGEKLQISAKSHVNMILSTFKLHPKGNGDLVVR